MARRFAWLSDHARESPSIANVTSPNIRVRTSWARTSSARAISVNPFPWPRMSAIVWGSEVPSVAINRDLTLHVIVCAALFDKHIDQVDDFPIEQH